MISKALIFQKNPLDRSMNGFCSISYPKKNLQMANFVDLPRNDLIPLEDPENARPWTVQRMPFEVTPIKIRASKWPPFSSTTQ